MCEIEISIRLVLIFMPWFIRLSLELIVICMQFPHLIVNSLAPGGCSINFKNMIFDPMLGKRFMSTTCEIALRWMSQDLTDD